MKKLIALAVVASAFASFAEDNVFGCLAIESSAEETIICVPWLQPGATSDDSSIKVTDVIKTSNLQTGDILYYYVDGAYKAWRLKEDKTWEPANIVDGTAAAAGADNDALTRGNAVLLKRPTKEGRASVIYVYGQVGTAEMKECALGAGTSDAACYTLIAPPTVGETDLNSGTTWANIDSKSDYIVLPDTDMTILVWNGEKWGKEGKMEVKDGKITKPFTAAVAKIPAGQGAWFVSGRSRTVSGTPSVTWSNLPSVGPTVAQ